MEPTAIVKAFTLLEATAATAEGRSLGQLAAEAGLSKPTTHRILKTLTALGYVERKGPGIYRQSPRARRLLGGGGQAALLDAAEPILRRLHAETEETINLGTVRQGRVVYLQVLESTLPLRRVVTPHSTDPFYCTALGRAIVAHLPPSQRETLLATARPEQRTQHTVTDAAELDRILSAVGQADFAVEEDQTDIGVTCIAAPVFDVDGVVAAISISIPSARAAAPARDRLVAMVKTAAKELSQRLTAEQEAGAR